MAAPVAAGSNPGMADKHTGKPTGQRDLFEHRPAWEEDDRAHGVVATVVLPDGVEKPLDYLVPEHLAAEVEPGKRVVVPLGALTGSGWPTASPAAAVRSPASRSRR